ncbi:MAG: D-alanyl-D-alanine carboxypeptidase [Nitrosomonadales bacterium]|nr:D-alanyl-D-alanine carboxypeptidase [Nitrosomonadales bacterium]
MKFALAFLFSVLLPPFASAQQPLVPPPPALAARAWLLYDLASNQILVAENGNERFEPASLTKMMTAYLAFAAIGQNRLALAQPVVPSAEALPANDGGSRMLLEPGKPVTVEDLLHGLIVQSGNDAARVLATAVAGSEESFAALMNREAQRLGMKNTRFANATGLSHPQHYSSAYDLALLAAAIARDFPDRYPIFGLREYQYNGIKQINRNRLLWVDPYVDGMKTGYSESAGFCLAASAKRDNRRLVSVLLGAASDNQRATESQKLLNYGFQYFEAVRLYQKNRPVTSLPLWKGTGNRVDIGFRNDLFLSVPKGGQAQLKATIETRQPLIAPVSGGQKIGVLKLALGGKPYAEFPLVALAPVPLANIFSRGWDSIRLFFQQGIF